MTQSDLRQELIAAMDMVDVRQIRDQLGADGLKYKSDFDAEGRQAEVVPMVDVAAMTRGPQQ